MDLRQILQKLSADLSAIYSERLIDFRDYLKLDFNSQLLSDDFHQALYKILFSENVENYSKLKSYWLKAVEDFFFILELHYDQDDGGLSEDEEDYSDEEREEELKEAWLKTPFADAYSDMLSADFSTTDASMALISLMESHLLAFYYAHFSDEELGCETAFLYNISPELGDYEGRIYLTDKFYYVDLEQNIELYPSIPIAEIDHERKLLGVEENAETSFLPLELNPYFAHTPSGKKIHIIPNSDEAAAQAELMSNKITESLKSNAQLALLTEELVDAIVISSQVNKTAEGFIDRIFIDISNDAKQLEHDLLEAASELAAYTIDEAYGLTNENDDNANFLCPWSNEKTPYLPIAIRTITMVLSARIKKEELTSAKKVFVQAKKSDLLTDESRDIIELLLNQ